MKNQDEMQTIDALIATDEKTIAALEAKLDRVTPGNYATEPGSNRVQILAWTGVLLTLRQGLEGLRLKHDALVDARESLATRNKDITERNREDCVDRIRKLLEQVISFLIDHPNLASVRSQTNANLTCLTVLVSASDFGKIIGKQGRTARSLKTILAAASMKHQHRFTLDIQDRSEATTLGADANARSFEDSPGLDQSARSNPSNVCSERS